MANLASLPPREDVLAWALEEAILLAVEGSEARRAEAEAVRLWLDDDCAPPPGAALRAVADIGRRRRTLEALVHHYGLAEEVPL